MPYIRTIVPEEATGDTKRLFDEAIKRAGHVFNIIGIQGLNPQAMEASLNLYKAIMVQKGPLRRTTREMLAVVVSRELECFY